MQEQSNQFHRPFERTGFVPLPQKLKKKLNKLTPNISTQKSNQQEIEGIYDESCEDCRDDCYEDKLNQILLYKLTNQYSLRLINIRNIRVRQQEEYIIAKNSQIFTISKCQNQTYHLFHKNHKVLMIREAFRLVANVHGQFHHDGETMKKIIETEHPYISNYFLTQFLFQFPLMCPYCRQFPSCQASQMPTPKSRMWYYLEPTRIDYQDDGDQNQIVTYSRPSGHYPYYISPNIRPIQQVIEQLKKFSKLLFSNLIQNVNMCSGNFNGTCEQNCVTDQYQSQYLIILYVYKENKYPLLRSNSQIGRLIQAARFKIREIEVRICNLGTPHLWHKQRNQRILMKDEITMVLSKLHNGNTSQSQIVNEQGRGIFHRNQKLMRYILQKETAIYPYNIIGNMRAFLNKCHVCCKKRFYRQHRRPEIQFQNHQMAMFRNKLHEDRKRYKEALEIPKNLTYDQFIQKKQSMKVMDQKKMEGISQGNMDQYDTHPNDKDHSPEVKEMMSRFSDCPELVQFLKNDLLWLIEFNEKKYPDFITNGNIQIKKYAYDGMYRVIFVSTQSMRRSYYTYGECLCIDFIPSMIKRRSPSGRHFQIGYLTGMDQNNSSVLFGVCFMSQDLMIYHRKMFDFFFESVKQVIPGTIITNSGKNLSQAVYLMKKEDPLKYKFNHYYSWFYVVEDLKRDLSGQYDRAEMLKEFCNLLLEANPISHEKRLIEITSQIVERTILQKFLKQKNKYCLSCLPPAFMGFAMSTNRVDQFYQLLMQSFVYQGRVAQFMYYLFEFQKKLNQKQVKINNTPNLQIITQYLGTGLEGQNQEIQVSEDLMLQLAELSEVLGETVLRNLMKNFVEAHKLVLFQQQDSMQRGDTFDAFFIDKDHLKYSVRYSTQDECWRCSCPWVYWTGVPCAHILKMIIKQGGDIIYYVNSRWIVQPGQQQALEPESKMETSQYKDENINSWMEDENENEKSFHHQIDKLFNK